MVNDLPTSLQDIDTSLFADDSAVYKSSRSVSHLQKVVQRNLDRIQEWCDMWGFRISLSKTVAVSFTNAYDTVNLTINGTVIKTEKTAKVLGMIFDSKLTWGHHIQGGPKKRGQRVSLQIF